MRVEARVTRCESVSCPYASVSIYLTREGEDLTAAATPTLAWYSLHIASAEDLIAAGESLIAVGRELRGDRLQPATPDDDSDDDRAPPETEARAALERARNEEVDPDAMEDPDD